MILPVFSINFANIVLGDCGYLWRISSIFFISDSSNSEGAPLFGLSNNPAMPLASHA